MRLDNFTTELGAQLSTLTINFEFIYKKRHILLHVVYASILISTRLEKGNAGTQIFRM
jgi:hypothetical protein